MSEASAVELNDRVRGLMAEQLGVEPAEMRPDANILEDLGADSLDVVELVMALEEAFDIEIGDEDAEAIRTVGDVEAYVLKRLS
jgi:acyl carrier protein